MSVYRPRPSPLRCSAQCSRSNTQATGRGLVITALTLKTDLKLPKRRKKILLVRFNALLLLLPPLGRHDVRACVARNILSAWGSKFTRYGGQHFHHEFSTKKHSNPGAPTTSELSHRICENLTSLFRSCGSGPRISRPVHIVCRKLLHALLNCGHIMWQLISVIIMLH